MDRVIAAQVYNRICELGSLSAAARALGISRPMVSRYLEQMEKWAGARLVNRSTRKLTLTAAGEKVLQKTRTLSQISQEIEDQSVKDLPSGTLRVACAHFTAMQIIAPVLPDLLQRYPQLRIELDVNNHPVSLVGERIDVAIRITDNPEPGMIARRLGECRSVLCASPHYLASRGVPEQLEDLARHNCLHYSFFAGQSWRFLTPEGEPITTAVSGNLSASISSLLMEAAILPCCPSARLTRRYGRAAWCRCSAPLRQNQSVFLVFISRETISLRRSVCSSTRWQTTLPRARTNLSSLQNGLCVLYLSLCKPKGEQE